MITDSGGVSEPREGQLATLALKKTELTTTHKMGLFQSTLLPSNDSVFADFDGAKANFTGYAAVAVAAAASPGVDGTGQAYLPLDTITFLSTDAVAPNIISGWYLWDDAAVPKKVKDYGVFTQPYNVNRALQTFKLDVFIREMGLSSWELEG